jgi:hypothetical protein
LQPRLDCEDIGFVLHHQMCPKRPTIICGCHIRANEMLTKLGPLVEWAFAGEVFYSSLIWTVTDTGFHKKKHVRAV